jgi:hypothetical protein
MVRPRRWLFPLGELLPATFLCYFTATLEGTGPECSLKATLEMINSKYGSVEGYLLQVIKLKPQEISALRARLLDP